MGTVSDQNFTDFFRQTVKTFSEDNTLYENQCPGYDFITENSEELEIDIKGYRIPLFASRPGGSTNVTPNNSSFNASVPVTSVSMFIFPTWYYLPMVFQEAAIDMAKKNKNGLINFGRLLKEWWDAACKRQEYYTYGDGSAQLGVITGSTLNVGANQTLTLTTTAATTFGQTKGALWLDKNSSYDSINPSTGQPRGNFTVVTQGYGATCVVNVNWGSLVSGDIVTDPGSYLKAPRGLAWLLSKVSRTLQGLPTSTYQELNSPTVDLANTLMTAADWQKLKAFLQYRYNKEGAKDGLQALMPFGQYANLSAQGYNLTVQNEKKTHGYAMEYQDGDTRIRATRDMDEDRTYLWYANIPKKFVERDLQVMTMGTPDEWRMLMGNNGTGSADFQRALEFHWNMGITGRAPGAYITRALTTGIATATGSYS